MSVPPAERGSRGSISLGHFGEKLPPFEIRVWHQPSGSLN